MTMATLLEFDLYVSILDYNKVASKVNMQIKKTREQEASLKLKMKSARKQRTTSDNVMNAASLAKSKYNSLCDLVHNKEISKI